jgi:threonine/homoserine/homoserine lactone efflux protein
MLTKAAIAASFDIACRAGSAILGRSTRFGREEEGAPVTTATLLAFALTATLLILAPGPDSLLVMRNTLRGGRRAGWATTCGTMSGLGVWAVAAALGLSALLRVSHVGYDALRLVGAGYLIWLGVSSLRPARRRPARRPGRPSLGEVATSTPGAREPGAWPPPDGAAAGSRPAGRMYLNGLLCDLCNPKIGVFFVAFLPGFIPARGSATAFSLALGLWFIVETGAWLAVLSWMVAGGVGWLRRSSAQRWLERATGVVLIGFGLRLAASAR